MRVGPRGQLGLCVGFCAWALWGCDFYEGRSLDLFAGVRADGCASALDCPGERPLCVRGSCVECQLDAQCGSAEPWCVNGACVECQRTEDCTVGRACNVELGACALACSEHSACAGQAQFLCDPELALCVECTSDADCMEARGPHCLAGGACVECSADADCVGDRAVCNPLGWRCVECLDDGDCEGGVCDTRDARCAECRTDADCPRDGSCEVERGRCRIPCSASGSCDPRRPHCDPGSGSCVECMAAGDCADPKKPVCGADQRCVECSADLDCSAAEKPGCVLATGRCEECTRPEHCPAAMTCDLASARCTASPQP